MKPLLEVKNLTVAAREKGGDQILVQDSSFSIQRGQCLGILGESGSGKSITCKAFLGLLDPRHYRITGQAFFDGIDLRNQSSEQLRRLRGKRLTMVLQNPMTCFDPLYRIGDQMAETFGEHTDLSAKEIKALSLEILERMRILNPEEALKKYPHQLSGGMLQRVMIGVAMALKPDLLVADEPTTALDTISQYDIMQEFLKIKRENSTTMIFVSHDLGVLSEIADHLIVMYRSRIVDSGSVEQVLCHPVDGYTRSLVEERRKVMKLFSQALEGSERRQ